MWTMGYNDSGGGDSFSNNARKLRPLVPRPLPSAPTNHPSTAPPAAPCLARIHGTDFFGLNHHHQLGSYLGEQNRRELDISSNTPPAVASSRWNPTPEQLRTLEELYRRGTRTPSAEQIQHITAQLRRYGKIEGKNVFYWFQNHKARERQKRRRQIMESSADQHHHDHLNNHLDFGTFKESATSKTDIEIEQNKSLAAPVNAHCSTLLAEEPISFTKASTAENSRQIGWNQVDEAEAAGGEFQQLRRSLVEKNATWQMMQCSCPHLINTSRTRTPDHDRTSPSVVTAMVDQKQLMKGARDHLGVFFSPYVENGHCLNNYLNTVTDDLGGADGWGASQTLQLFPLRSSGHGDSMDDKSDHKVITDVPATAMDASHSPYQFFEFLPLKN